jgi:hypothetical protein
MEGSRLDSPLLFKLSCAGWPVLVGLSCVLVILFRLVCPGRPLLSSSDHPVPAGLSLQASPVLFWSSCSGWSVLAGLSCPLLVILFRLACPGRPLLSSSGHPVPAGLSWQASPVLFWSSSSGRSVLAGLSCTVLAILFWPVCLGRPVLSCSGFHNPGFHRLALLSVISSPCCPVQSKLFFLKVRLACPGFPIQAVHCTC